MVKHTSCIDIMFIRLTIALYTAIAAYRSAVSVYYRLGFTIYQYKTITYVAKN